MYKTHHVWILGLLILALGADVVTSSDPAPSLLVQQALREAQASLQRGEPATAVRLLERQLPHINGNAAYLELLGRAYECYLLELRQLGRTDLLPTYLERLAILNPLRAASLREQWQLSRINEGSTNRIVARGRIDDEPVPTAIRPTDLLSLADEAFVQRQYPRARLLYWRAYYSQQSLSPLQKQRWAYSTLHDVHARLHEPAFDTICWPVIYREAERTLQLAPTWPFAQQLVKEVERKLLQYRIPIHHEHQRHNSWYVSRSAHFRIYHRQASLAEQVLLQAEQTLYLNAWFWFGELEPPNWDQPCEIYLHPDGVSLARATGVPPTVCGFSTLTHDTHKAGRVLARRIDLNAQTSDLLSRIVPHETTHVALASRFGERPIPRWADEGLAVLVEPAEVRQIYRDQARRALQHKTALPIETLITLEDYPSQFQSGIFYGQSLLLVEYLLQRGDKWKLVLFLTEARRTGFEPALRRCYGITSLQELAENAWHRDFPAPENPTSHLVPPFAPRLNPTATSQGTDYGWNRR